VVIGGGIAGVEALLALHDLAGDRAQLTLVAPEPDFVYKPLKVEEPFGGDPVEQRALEPLVGEVGGEFRLAALESVDPAAHRLLLSDGSSLNYEKAVICVGGRFEPAFEGVDTFPTPKGLAIEQVLTKSHVAGADSLAFVVPPSVTWPLPIYELALMTERRARERNYEQLSIRVITPETAPLAVFGPAASSEVAQLLSARGIEFIGDARVHQENGELLLTPGDERLGRDEVVALPVMKGPALEGLPADDDGFIPIDDHARVRGTDDLYAAGDGTNFPIKQGGLATQEADAAAAHIAHALGAALEVEPFHPVLRGKLLTGDESLQMRADVAGGAGEGEASADALWWPPHKVSGRYLAAWLYHGEAQADPEPPARTLDVEVALPREWHEQPMALDPESPPGID